MHFGAQREIQKTSLHDVRVHPKNSRMVIVSQRIDKRMAYPLPVPSLSSILCLTFDTVLRYWHFRYRIGSDNEQSFQVQYLSYFSGYSHDANTYIASTEFVRIKTQGSNQYTYTIHAFAFVIYAICRPRHEPNSWWFSVPALPPWLY